MQQLVSKIENFVGGSLWNVFGSINLLYIVPANTYYGTRILLQHNKNVRKEFGNDNLFLICNSVPIICLLSAVITVKTTLYYLSGPLGTMRILLAYAKLAETGDQKYVDIINVPMSSSTHDTKYILPYISDE